MRRIRSTFLLLLALSSPLGASTVEEEWLSVHLDGRRIGYLHSTREVAGERVLSTRSMSLRVERNGQALGIATRESSEETRDGRPLAFASELDAGGITTVLRGQVGADGRTEVRTLRGDDEQLQVMDWPEGAVLAEGQRLAEREVGLEPGAVWQVTAFDVTSLAALEIETRVRGPETVPVHGQPESLVALEQTTRFEGGSTSAEAWVDADGDLRRLRLPLMGLVLEAMACHRACATAEPQPADVFDATLIRAPRALRASDRREPLEYLLRHEGESAGALASVPGQQLRVLDEAGLVRLRVDPRGGPGEPPQPADLAATRWLEADAPALREAAEGATADLPDAPARMQALEDFVRGHVSEKSLRVGYASALETLRGREGDCTEHAVLLAAMARAVGIPARVVTGVAYAPVFGDHRRVFVPHAWVIAWVDGGWRGYDAALPGFDAGHIGFGAGDGDPFRFYAGVDLLGRLQVEAVEPLEDAAP